MIDLSNNSLTGPLPPDIVSGFPNLDFLYFRENSFNGTIPHWVFSLPSLKYLRIESNQLAGEVYEFQYSSLEELSLSGNKRHGAIPKLISTFLNLTELDLSYNNFSGELEVSFFSNMKKLDYLCLSFNNISLINHNVNPSNLPSLARLFLSSCGVKHLDFLERANNLAMLDLSDNMLSGQMIKDQKSYIWAQRLFYLNLSRNFLTDIPHDLPSQRVVFLDVRSNLISGPLIVPSFYLKYFFVSDNNFTIEIPSSICNLTSLLLLDLSNNNLSGVIPPCLVNMSTELSALDLHNNNFQGTSPSSFSVGNSLRSLNLRDNWFGGTVPGSLSNCRELEIVDFGNDNLSGAFPWWLGTLPKLQVLSLRDSHLYGELNISRTGSSFPALRIPSSLANLQQLVTLYLDNNGFEGQLSNFFRNFKNLTQLSLSNNFFSGYFPSSILNLTNLEMIDLSNNSLIGPLPPEMSGFPYLDFLYLSDNSFNGTIPNWVFSLPSLKFLSMESNQLSGQVYEFQYPSLQEINLSGNKLHGPIPKSISTLLNLTGLYLSHNNFNGDVEVSLFSNLKKLQFLDLSFNNISLINNQVNPSTLPSSIVRLFLSSCGVKDLNFLEGANYLDTLDLSDNMLRGQIFTDQKSYIWAQGLFYLNLSRNFLTDIRHLPSQHLVYLDLRSNLLSGPLVLPSVDLKHLLVSDNSFSGEIPLSICDLTSLILLDLSNNNLSGVIPPCLGNLSTELSLLDLHTNNFHGTIPSSFSVGSNLRRLNLRDNWLGGTIPRSLSNCSELEIVDFGNNNLSSTFPWWLETLPKLQVLSLRANQLYGQLNISRTGSSFPVLRILDISRNELRGTLPGTFFGKLNGMKMVNRGINQPMFKDELLYYRNSLIITIKGQDVDVVSVLSILTTLDVSDNKFEGAIPDVIGNLISLQCLNLSHNTLGGQIPQILGNIADLESLDLSSNQLEGEIPQQLTALTYLSVLNLSQNHLAGSIPRGQQFNTFDNSSYLGNDGLCGFPLSKSCGANELVPPTSTTPAGEEKDNKGFINGFTWKAVLIGYGSGMVIGMSMGCLSFITGKPKWFNKIVQEEGSKLIKKKWAKEVKWLSK